MAGWETASGCVFVGLCVARRVLRGAEELCSREGDSTEEWARSTRREKYIFIFNRAFFLLLLNKLYFSVHSGGAV